MHNTVGDPLPVRDGFVVVDNPVLRIGKDVYVNSQATRMDPITLWQEKPHLKLEELHRRE